MDPKVELLTKEWFRYAEQDLKAASKLLGEFNHIVCFHAQQAAEKYIKGILIFNQIEFRKVHDLVYLLNLVNSELPDEITFAAEYLTEYAVTVRYPGEFIEITITEAEKAIEYAEKIKKYMLAFLQK
jgi:HEPN domain-containing protein